MKSHDSGTYLNRFLVLYTFLKIVHSQMRSEILRSTCINDIFLRVYENAFLHRGGSIY